MFLLNIMYCIAFHVMCCNNNSQVCILVIMQDILNRDAAGGSSTAAVPAAGKPSFGLQSGNVNYP